MTGGEVTAAVGGSEGAAHSHDVAERYGARGGSLYVVATPLGNLRDLTLRALDVLSTVDVVAAEDTRTTGRLLRHYGISARTLSLHAHNEAERATAVIQLLGAGKSVALVSDAGTPAISDPGARLVRAVREAEFAVVPIPGPSAVTAALSVAGLVAETCIFVGFLPSQQKARREQLEAVAHLQAALVFFEAPHRVVETATDLLAVLGPARELLVARELTKTFETISRISLVDAPAWFSGDPNRQRGEFVLLVDVPPPREKAQALSAGDEAWLVALLVELPPARAARVVAAMTGVPRDAIYARALALKGDLR